MAAREKVLEILKLEGTISERALLLRTICNTVKRIKKRYEQEGMKGLSDVSRRAKNFSKRTPPGREALMISEAKKRG